MAYTLPESHAPHAPQDAFAPAMRPGLPHLVGALPQLQSYNDMGPTVYALTVFGAHRGAIGGGALAGPAVSAIGVTDDWPEAAQHAAKALFAKSSSGRKAGAVVVILIVQVGRESHCVLINVPTAARERARRDAEIPMSCAASVLAFGY